MDEQSVRLGAFEQDSVMERPMTAAQRRVLLRQHPGQSLLVFPECRERPIRRQDLLPRHWRRDRANAPFGGQARPGEWFAFQLGVYAARRPARGLALACEALVGPPGARIGADAFTCINLTGVDWQGRAFCRDVAVPLGQVQPLWIGVAIPTDAPPGRYTGAVTVTATGLAPVRIPLTLEVNGEPIAAGGDDEPWRHSRLRWLNSTIARDDQPVAPFTPLRVQGRQINCLGRAVELAATGLPQRIISFFSPSVTRIERGGQDLLAEPVAFRVETADGEMKWAGDGPAFTEQSAGTVRWRATSRSQVLTLVCNGTMEFDGTLSYCLTLRAERTVELSDARLEVLLRADLAPLMMGLGRPGGRRPDALRWRWNHQHQDSLWLGSPQAGVRCKFYGEDYVRPVINAHYRHGPLIKPACWHNRGRGGLTLGACRDTVLLRVYSGARTLAAGEEVTFCCDLQLTPCRPLDTDAHWQQRYFHGAALPPAEIARMGANVINLHHASDLNPFINYPFFTEAVDRLSRYVAAAHEQGLKAKVYYTMRELTTRLPELWALRSLGQEVLLGGDGTSFFAPKASACDPWLRHHLRDDFTPAWRHVFTEGAYQGQVDASILTVSLSRWCNAYLEGLDWLCREVGIDGLYIDDVCFDRTVMQRARRILQQRRPGALVDLHSWNHLNAHAGFINSPLLYLELMPYLDRLWLGEGFNYNESPEYWLVEMSGICFGLLGEMLQDGGNPWRGMLFGMTQRLPWAGDPRNVWQVWDDFGMAGSEMIGWWDPACPVHSDHPQVLATVYRQPGRALIALASWAPTPVEVRLDIAFAALGLDPATAELAAPAMDRFQAAARFAPGEPITVAPGKGWLLVLRPMVGGPQQAARQVPAGNAQ